MQKIIDYLMANQDLKYRDFNKNITPVDDDMIGVRTPILKNYAKILMKEDEEVAKAFLRELPHKYFEENQLHGFMISLIKDYDEALHEVELFLPYINNWATCDQTKPKVFGKNKDKLLINIEEWISSTHTYTIRFAIEMLMNYYLDEDFDVKYVDMVCQVSSEEYYVKMMQAWYMATALAKQYDAVLPYIEKKVLPEWTHRKSIQKAVESYRITDEQKTYLRSLK